MSLDKEKKYLKNGELKEDKFNFKGALKEYNKAIKINPKYAEAYYKRGCVTYRSLYDNAGAIKDFSKAIKLNPQFAAAYDYRGHMKIELKDINGGIEDFSRSIELNPKSGGSYYARACAKEDLGNIEGAVEDLRIADELGFAGAYEMMQKIQPSVFLKHKAAIKRHNKRSVFSRFESAQYKEYHCRVLSGKEAVYMLHQMGRSNEEDAKRYGGSIKTFYFDNLGEKEAFIAGFATANKDYCHAIINDIGEQIL